MQILGKGGMFLTFSKFDPSEEYACLSPSSPFSKRGKSGIFHRGSPRSSPPFEKGRTGGISGKVFSKR
jgi:hypothetical protein